MKIVYTDIHKKHHSMELVDGALQPSFEMPSRAEYVKERAEEIGLGEFIPPKEFPLELLERVHTKEYIKFISTAYEKWIDLGNKGDAFPFVWPVHGMRRIKPESFIGQLGYFNHSMDCGISNGTWEAVKWSAFASLTGQELISKGEEQSVFSLCRPPGHHAHADLYGGYCYVNNAALSAESFIQDGHKKVVLLDVDYHHGNGSQSIFYDRDDVLFVSLHADPATEYPHFLGYADETGEGKGEGFNINYPMPFGTTYPEYEKSLLAGCEKIKAFNPDILVVSLGVDTYKDDPISKFKLDSPDFVTIGQHISKLGLPTHFVMEGGYAVEQIGINAINVLTGYENA